MGKKTSKNKVKKHGKNKAYHKRYITARRTKDLDQIQEELAAVGSSMNDESLPPAKVPFDLDLPGGGQYYCMHCARHFIGPTWMDEHLASKQHKRRYV